MSSHDREFPSEDGGYVKWPKPMTVVAMVCRADWVQGTTGMCRARTKDGEKRKDGWTPQECILCNTLEASPCRDKYILCVANDNCCSS